VVLYLLEAGLDVIGMNKVVVIGVQNPEVVCLDKDSLIQQAKLALSLEPCGMW
jgi:hypothetical protein